MFCQKCGAILVPKKGRDKTKLACSSCNYIPKERIKAVITEEVKKQEVPKIEVVDKTIETSPKTEQECPKCRNKIAYYWLVQTRSADEAETRFFQCTKCSYRWRSYE